MIESAYCSTVVHLLADGAHVAGHSVYLWQLQLHIGSQSEHTHNKLARCYEMEMTSVAVPVTQD
jgi:hypothetical protein